MRPPCNQKSGVPLILVKDGRIRGVSWSHRIMALHYVMVRILILPISYFDARLPCCIVYLSHKA